ncbi:hypothetical protein WAI453_007170 [Rhynchosporium graminicola]
MMADLASRLDDLRPTVLKLMAIGGTPGVSLGLMVKGKQVYQANYGYRDASKKLPINEDTTNPVCSMTKAVTSAAMGILVEENKVQWDTLVKDALPGFHISDDILQNQMTITDLLCHRAGLSWADKLIIGTENNVLVSGDDAMKFFNSQTRLMPFRGAFAYNNMGYEIAGKVIEALNNVGACYNTLDEGIYAQIPCVKLGDNGFGSAHAGMRRCVNDLMKLYNAFISSFNDQFATGKSATKGSPLKQVKELMSAKIPMGQPTKNEVSYGLGWARIQLPGAMGQIGINPDLLPEGMPIVGKEVSSQLLIFHQGSLPGALSIVILLPESQSAIFVTTNSLALNDVPDWIGQLFLEALLEVPSAARNDYIKAAEKTRAENLKWYPNLIQELKQAQENGTSPRNFEDYAGTYWDKYGIFKIIVTVQEGKLYWKLQGLESEKFELSHYQNDSFTWLATRNELSRRGRWVGGDQGPDFWKVEFKTASEGKISHLSWSHDNGVLANVYIKS